MLVIIAFSENLEYKTILDSGSNIPVIAVDQWPSFRLPRGPMMSAGKQSATAFLQIDFTATALVGGHSQFRNLAREGKSGQKEEACFTQWDLTHLWTRWNQPRIEKEAHQTKIGKQRISDLGVPQLRTKLAK